MPVKFKVAGGLVFANYFTPGAHRATIDPSKMIIPRVEINIPRYVPYNPPQIYIPQQPGGFR